MQQSRDLIDGRCAREGKGIGKVYFKTVLITRGFGTARVRHDSMIKISIARGFSTPVNKGDTQDTAERNKDKEESAKETGNRKQTRGRLSKGACREQVCQGQQQRRRMRQGGQGQGQGQV